MAIEIKGSYKHINKNGYFGLIHLWEDGQVPYRTLIFTSFFCFLITPKHTHTHAHAHTDRLTGVSFILPDQYYKIGAIPAGVTLLFHSTLSTQYNTTIYGSVHYDWDFGDGNSL